MLVSLALVLNERKKKEKVFSYYLFNITYIFQNHEILRFIMRDNNDDYNDNNNNNAILGQKTSARGTSETLQPIERS